MKQPTRKVKLKPKLIRHEAYRIAERDRLVTRLQMSLEICDKLIRSYADMVREYAADKLSKEKLLSAAEIFIRLMAS